jgi:hypothetical protein
MYDLNKLIMSTFRLYSDLEISDCGIIEILHLTMPGGTVEKHKKPESGKPDFRPLLKTVTSTTAYLMHCDVLIYFSRSPWDLR